MGRGIRSPGAGLFGQVESACVQPLSHFPPTVARQQKIRLHNPKWDGKTWRDYYLNLLLAFYNVAPDDYKSCKRILFCIKMQSIHFYD